MIRLKVLLGIMACLAVTTVSAEGLNPELKARAVAQASQFSRLHSLVVAYQGQIEISESFGGPGVDRPANIKSLSKTVLSAIVGAAVDRDVVTMEQTVPELIPRRIPSNASVGIDKITLEHLVSMRAGLERTSGGNYGRWVVSSDWVAFALSRPFVDEPGGRMLYSTGSTHLASVALTETSGRSTLALARDWLGDPLGITVNPWLRDPQGFYFGGNDMVMSPNDLLRFGEMYRQGGMFNGQRVLSERWIEESWRGRGTSPWSNDDYGYGWFITELAGERVYYGRGYGGQLLYVIPSMQMTVVITSDPNPPSPGGRYVRELHRFVGQALISAAQLAAAS
ncbi:beta-lactamase family protein [Salinispirillum sp. LH 10-3-1]|uniref:Beta-lactamase family protein n=1 Tax=Salinispirillum sp. LH 10-3-1 TaxID=2952525 RepID=A0AB38YE46_9GAMM